ncbi:MAG: hypothetical protein JETT_1188 [Candidatus Jettenia ecosi]|uniref:Uncharacterized protein n=1 Tax=Candidatus Jettenia ecosi TaxID=2494326 RepID=A0A533QCR6_9BACT|nr:MAG: hypothetical protein JETT_1188 [Candidatus Jettenia ecosi]
MFYVSFHFQITKPTLVGAGLKPTLTHEKNRANVGRGFSLICIKLKWVNGEE